MAQSSAKRINQLISELKYRSYLEIGVASGNTFHNVVCEKKIAVDPNFRFDKTLFQDEAKDLSFFEISSDEFFNMQPKHVKVDLIFLDGLHTFEQTYRDLLNSLEIVSDVGAIILDDVFPLDYAGSLKSMREMLEYRTQSNDISPRHWWGDVYKVIFMLHDYHLFLDYRTCFDGKVQTIVRNSSFCDRKAIFDEVTKISSLSFEGFQGMHHVYKEDSLDNIITFLRSAD